MKKTINPISAMEKNRLKNKTLTIHSNRTKTKAGSRFYIHAQDVAAAVIHILDRGKNGEKYNIVGPQEIDNLQLAKIIAKKLKRKLKYDPISEFNCIWEGLSKK